VKTSCTHCGFTQIVPDMFEGHKATCQSCGEIFRVRKALPQGLDAAGGGTPGEDRRSEERIPVMGMRVYMDECIREFPVKDLSMSGIAIYHLHWSFCGGEEVLFDLIDEGEIILKGMKAKTVRIDDETVGCEFEELDFSKKMMLTSFVMSKLRSNQPLKYSRKAMPDPIILQDQEKRAVRVYLDEMTVRSHDYQKDFSVKNLSIDGMAFFHGDFPSQEHKYLILHLMHNGRYIAKDLKVRITRVDEEVTGCVFEDLSLAQVEVLYTLISTKIDMEY